LRHACVALRNSAVSRCLAVGFALWLSAPRAALADKPTVRASVETGAYQDTTATTVFTPTIAGSIESPTEGWGVNGRYLVDIVSAASPDIVSTASPKWLEVRNVGNLAARYKPGLTGGNLSAVISHTPDYLSIGGTLGITRELDDKLLTLVGSYGYQHDVIGRTGVNFSVFSRKLDTHSFSFALSSIVSPSTILTFVGDLQLERGDQSKPYRYIPLFTSTRAGEVGVGAAATTVNRLRSEEKPLEQLPLGRERYALTTRLANREDGKTLRLEERIYVDSWGQIGSTTDARYLMDVGSRFRVWPHVRLHYQSPVTFWQRAYVSSGPADIPAIRTGDRELGQLLNAGFGAGARMALGPSENKESWGLLLTADASWTRFFDALYITQRLSVISVLNLEAVFE
jgi:Protein of unknown function (DUF3570)